MRAMLQAAAALFASAAISSTAQADGWRVIMPLAEGGQARGQDQGAVDGNGVYLEPEVGYQHQSLPRFRFGRVDFQTSTPFYDVPIDVQGPRGGLSFGTILPRAMLSDELHLPESVRNLRFEISGAMFDLQGTHSTGTPGGMAPGSIWTFVGGNLPGGTGGVFNANLHTQYTGYEVSLRAAADVAASADVMLTPAVYVFGGQTNTAHDYNGLDACFLGGRCFDDFVQERIGTSDTGLGASLGSRWSPVEGLSLFLGAGIAAVHTRASLGATDCFDIDPFSAGCQTVSPLFSERRTTAERFGYRGEIQVGVGYDFGIARLNLDGSLRYSSAVAGATNPTEFGDRAGLTFRGEPGFTLGLRLVIPIDNVY